MKKADTLVFQEKIESSYLFTTFSNTINITGDEIEFTKGAEKVFVTITSKPSMIPAPPASITNLSYGNRWYVLEGNSVKNYGFCTGSSKVGKKLIQLSDNTTNWEQSNKSSHRIYFPDSNESSEFTDTSIFYYFYNFKVRSEGIVSSGLYEGPLLDPSSSSKPKLYLSVKDGSPLQPDEAVFYTNSNLS